MGAATLDIRIRPAIEREAGSIASLVNEAFEVERFFIDGDRTDEPEVRALLGRGEILVAELEGRIIGSVYIEVRDGRGYLGMLSVSPSQQRAGIGRLLVDAAEARFRAAGCVAVDVKIVHLRTELPPYYRALGYRETGTAPFPPDEQLRRPVHFVCMSKPL